MMEDDEFSFKAIVADDPNFDEDLDVVAVVRAAEYKDREDRRQFGRAALTITHAYHEPEMDDVIDQLSPESLETLRETAEERYASGHVCWYGDKLS